MENLFTHAEKRDEALSLVASHSPNWIELAMIEMRELSRDPAIERDYPQGFTMTNLRQWLVPIIGQPNHCNAWGAFGMKCLRAGLLIDTGRISRGGAKARKQPVYVWGLS